MEHQQMLREMDNPRYIVLLTQSTNQQRPFPTPLLPPLPSPSSSKRQRLSQNTNRDQIPRCFVFAFQPKAAAWLLGSPPCPELVASPRSFSGDDGDGGITPPHLLDAEQEVGDDGVDMPPPLLPDPESFALSPPHPGWGTWHLEPADDGGQDHGHGHHADDDPLGFGAEPADATEDGEGPVIVPEQPGDGEEGDEEEENVFIPHYDFNLLMQPEEEFDPEMPPPIEDSEDYDERLGGEPIALRSLDDVYCIRSHPQHGNFDYIVVCFKFRQTLDVLNGVKMAWEEQDWRWIGNFKQLLRAARLARTIAELNKRLSCLSRSFQDHYLEKDLILSLNEFLPNLAAWRTSLQPALIRYYAEAITAALKFLSAQVPSGPCLLCYHDVDAAVQYMLERIGALQDEEVNYRDDVTLLEQPMHSPFGYDDGEEEVNDDALLQEQHGEEEEDEQDCVYDMRLLLQEEDENDPEMPSQDDEQFVVIRGLSGLEHIKSAPQTYSRSYYYIVESFSFGDVWNLLDGITEVSESQGWLWVGNLELIRQVHDLRDSFALLHHDLNRLLRDHHFDRESVSSLECFTSELNFSRTSKQPPNIRYWVDSIAVALQALLAMLRDEVSAEPHTRHTDFSDIDARVQLIIQRMNRMDRERVKYSLNVFPSEVLPALPGYPPIPLQASDTSPLPTPENSP